MSRHPVAVLGVAFVLGFAACGSGAAGGGHAGQSGAAGPGGAAGSASAGRGGSAGAPTGSSAGAGGRAGASAPADAGTPCATVPPCIVNMLNMINACTPSGTCVQETTTTAAGEVKSYCFSNGVKTVQTFGATLRTEQQFKGGSLCYTLRAVETDGGTLSSFAVEDPAGLFLGSVSYSPGNGNVLLSCEGQSADVDACLPKTTFASCTVGTCR